jgi:SET domain-containing protein
MHINSFLSKKCVVLPSTIEGNGVFAAKKIVKGELIAVWGGSIYTTEEIKEICKKFPEFSTHPFGVYEGLYMGPNSPGDPLDDAELFNHSCDPNAGVRGQIVVIARKDIDTNEEVCFDYETVETSRDALDFDCKCNTKLCRGGIFGDAWHSQDFRKKNEGFLSYYIQEKIMTSENKLMG